MKCLFIISFFTLFFSAAYAQNAMTLSQANKPGNVTLKDIRLQTNYAFTPFTESELINRSFFMKPCNEAGYISRPDVNKTVNLLIPGYYQPNEIMSTGSMCSNVRKLKFYCNYYFDAEGQLQDGDITISKIK